MRSVVPSALCVRPLGAHHSPTQQVPASTSLVRRAQRGEVTDGTFLQLVNANAEFKPKTLLSDLVADSLLGMLCKL